MNYAAGGVIQHSFGSYNSPKNTGPPLYNNDSKTLVPPHFPSQFDPLIILPFIV